MSNKHNRPRQFFGHGIADPQSAPEISSDRLTHVHPDDLDAYLARFGETTHLSFDDGYADNLLTALPILERYSQPACVFVTTGFVARRAVLLARVAAHVARNGDWQHPCVQRLASVNETDEPAMVYRRLRDALQRQTVAERAHHHAELLAAYGLTTTAMTDDYLDREQLNQLAAHPLITIGAHTQTHPDLRFCTDTELIDELAGARTTLEQWLHVSVDRIAYPFGLTDQRVRRAAARAGYRYGYVTETANWRSRVPIYGRLDIPRIDLSGEVRRMHRRARKKAMREAERGDAG